MVGAGGLLGLDSSNRDGLEFGPRLTTARVAQCDRRAGSRRTMRILRWGDRLGPTAAGPGDTGRALYHYDHGKVEQPQPRHNGPRKRERRTTPGPQPSPGIPAIKKSAFHY